MTLYWGTVFALDKMKLKYGLDEIPPFVDWLLLGLQWLAISTPPIILVGKLVAGLHYPDPLDQVIYIQKLFFVTAIALLVQLIWGHRLPLNLGPASVLLIGVVASQGSDLNAIYSSIMIGGIVLFLVSITGMFGLVRKFFTSRVIATILILIAFTLAPTIMNLIVIPDIRQASASFNLAFTLILVLSMFLAGRYLAGIWKSTLVIWGMIIGSLVYYLMVPQYSFANEVGYKLMGSFFYNLNLELSLEPGMLISFLVCFLALSINDLGSIQSVGELIKAGNMSKRITRGISLTGLANLLSGFLGVIGPVNFSLSPGIIAFTGSASRFTLMPAALGLLILAFLPSAIGFMGNIPSVVIGSVLIYLMCSQIAAGLLMAFDSMGGFKFEDGLIMGLPFMLGIIVSFLPGDVLSTFPASIRPIVGNGFVIGVLSVLLLEHLIIPRD